MLEKRRYFTIYINSTILYLLLDKALYHITIKDFNDHKRIFETNGCNMTTGTHLPSCLLINYFCTKPEHKELHPLIFNYKILLRKLVSVTESKRKKTMVLCMTIAYLMCKKTIC
jgi:hypothetical protein